MTCSFTRILVPVDFSATSLRALEYAKAIARQFDGDLYLVHVVDDPVSAAAWTEGYALSAVGLRERMAADADAALTRVAASVGNTAVESKILCGPAARTIADAAAEMHADLIVMGTHGRSGISHLLLGSVAERVVRMAPCPVLTVRDGAAPEIAASALERVAVAPAS